MNKTNEKAEQEKERLFQYFMLRFKMDAFMFPIMVIILAWLWMSGFRLGFWVVFVLSVLGEIGEYKIQKELKEKIFGKEGYCLELT